MFLFSLFSQLGETWNKGSSIPLFIAENQESNISRNKACSNECYRHFDLPNAISCFIQHTRVIQWPLWAFNFLTSSSFHFIFFVWNYSLFLCHVRFVYLPGLSIHSWMYIAWTVRLLFFSYLLLFFVLIIWIQSRILLFV